MHMRITSIQLKIKLKIIVNLTSINNTMERLIKIPIDSQ
jgi:hypothetical protein